MAGLAFISYRRDDASQTAQALYLQLKEIFGSGQFFMDVNSIRAGEAWPDRVRRRLDDATVLLALIGPGWLIAADQYGRRRIDDPTDWVRNEILHVLRKQTPIIPVVINHRQNLPDPNGLPPELAELPLTQARVLRLDPAEWAADILALSNLLPEYGLVHREVAPPPHAPAAEKRAAPALTEQALAAALDRLPGWEEWVDALALEYPRVRQELRRTFAFSNFLEAMRFMALVAPRLDAMKHHPRWGNEAGLVRIRLTTWDAGNKITRYDVEAAHVVEAAYREFTGES